jgi:hypothetical protein
MTRDAPLEPTRPGRDIQPLSFLTTRINSSHEQPQDIEGRTYNSIHRSSVKLTKLDKQIGMTLQSKNGSLVCPDVLRI